MYSSRTTNQKPWKGASYLPFSWNLNYTSRPCSYSLGTKRTKRWILTTKWRNSIFLDQNLCGTNPHFPAWNCNLSWFLSSRNEFTFSIFWYWRELYCYRSATSLLNSRWQPKRKLNNRSKSILSSLDSKLSANFKLRSNEQWGVTFCAYCKPTQ